MGTRRPFGRAANASAGPGWYSLLAVTVLLGGCGAGAGSGNSGNNISVRITNKFVSVSTGASAFVVNAIVQNDSSNSGVSWALTANGAACTPVCGTLSGVTTTSVTYMPPTSIPPVQPTLTAASVHDTSKSDSNSFTIQKAPISVSIGNKVGTVYAGGSQIFFEANVQNDPSNSGVTWTLTANGSP